jgi:hypothetical protein
VRTGKRASFRETSPEREGFCVRWQGETFNLETYFILPPIACLRERVSGKLLRSVRGFVSGGREKHSTLKRISYFPPLLVSALAGLLRRLLLCASG